MRLDIKDSTILSSTCGKIYFSASASALVLGDLAIRFAHWGLWSTSSGAKPCSKSGNMWISCFFDSRSSA